MVGPALEHCFTKPHTWDISSALRNFRSSCENRECLKQGLVGEDGRHMAEGRRFGLLLSPSSAVFARSLEPSQTSSSLLTT